MVHLTNSFAINRNRCQREALRGQAVQGHARLQPLNHWTDTRLDGSDR